MLGTVPDDRPRMPTAAFGNPFASLPAPVDRRLRERDEPAPGGRPLPAGDLPADVDPRGRPGVRPRHVRPVQRSRGRQRPARPASSSTSPAATITADTVTLGAAATGTYANLAMWNATTNDWNVHQDTVEHPGRAVLTPRRLINGNGNSSVTIGVIIVKYLDFSGSSDVTVTARGRRAVRRSRRPRARPCSRRSTSLDDDRLLPGDLCDHVVRGPRQHGHGMEHVDEHRAARAAVPERLRLEPGGRDDMRLPDSRRQRAGRRELRATSPRRSRSSTPLPRR